MSLRDAMNSLSTQARTVPGVGVPAWHREWKSTHKHNKAHCRARFQEGPNSGQYCQNKKFTGSQYCRMHMEEKWHYCSATTVAGKRCKKRPFRNWLCMMHWSQATRDTNKAAAHEILTNLRAKGDQYPI